MWQDQQIVDAEVSPVRFGVRYLNRVFVGNLHTATHEEELRKVLERHGHFAEDIKIIRDVYGHSKGYGFVDFGSESLAQQLLSYQPPIKGKFDRVLLISEAVRMNRPKVVLTRGRRARTRSSVQSSPACQSTQSNPNSPLEPSFGSRKNFYNLTLPVSATVDQQQQLQLQLKHLQLQQQQQQQQQMTQLNQQQQQPVSAGATMIGVDQQQEQEQLQLQLQLRQQQQQQQQIAQLNPGPQMNNLPMQICFSPMLSWPPAFQPPTPSTPSTPTGFFPCYSQQFCCSPQPYSPQPYCTQPEPVTPPCVLQPPWGFFH